MSTCCDTQVETRLKNAGKCACIKSYIWQKLETYFFFLKNDKSLHRMPVLYSDSPSSNAIYKMEQWMELRAIIFSILFTFKLPIVGYFGWQLKWSNYTVHIFFCKIQGCNCLEFAPHGHNDEAVVKSLQLYHTINIIWIRTNGTCRAMGPLRWINSHPAFLKTLIFHISELKTGLLINKWSPIFYTKKNKKTTTYAFLMLGLKQSSYSWSSTCKVKRVSLCSNIFLAIQMSSKQNRLVWEAYTLYCWKSF